MRIYPLFLFSLKHFTWCLRTASLRSYCRSALRRTVPLCSGSHYRVLISQKPGTGRTRFTLHLGLSSYWVTLLHCAGSTSAVEWDAYLKINLRKWQSFDSLEKRTSCSISPQVGIQWQQLKNYMVVLIVNSVQTIWFAGNLSASFQIEVLPTLPEKNTQHTYIQSCAPLHETVCNVLKTM